MGYDFRYQKWLPCQFVGDKTVENVQIYSKKSGGTYFQVRLILQDTSHAIKGLSTIVGMLVPLDLLNGLTLRC